MLEYIVCRCGQPLGDIYDLFVALRRDAIIESLGDSHINPNMISVSEDNQVELNDVFEQLNVKHQCCKNCIMTSAIFSDYY